MGLPGLSETLSVDYPRVMDVPTIEVCKDTPGVESGVPGEEGASGYRTVCPVRWRLSLSKVAETKVVQC